MSLYSTGYSIGGLLPLILGLLIGWYLVRKFNLKKKFSDWLNSDKGA